MNTVYVLVAGYHDGGVTSVELLAAYASKEAAVKALNLIQKVHPSMVVLMLEAPFEYGNEA